MKLHPAFAHVNTWVFDLDGTLYMNVQSILDTYRHGLRTGGAMAMNVSPEHIADLYEAAKKQGKDPIVEMIANGLPPEAWINAHADIDYSVIDYCERTADLIEKLPGTKTILTNAPASHARKVLERIAISHHFELISTADERGFTFKPHQPVYEKILADINGHAHSSVMVEDIEHNLSAPKTMGMTTVLVNAPPAKNTYVDHQFDTLVDFLTLVLNKKENAA